MNEKPTNQLKQFVTEEAQGRARQQHIKDEQFAEQQQSKNPPFVQMSKANLAITRQLAKRAPAAFQVMMVLVEKMNRMNAIACSQKTLAKITDCNLRTIKRAIALLEEEKWVQVIKIGTSNAYVVNSKVFWQNTREGRFAVFNATIVADQEEQNFKAEDWDGIELKHFPYLAQNEQAILAGPDEKQQEIDL